MNREHLELLKKVFPTSSVEREGEDIVVDLLLRFSDYPFSARSLRGERVVPGFQCCVENEDCTEITHCPNFGQCVIEASGWLARYHAIATVDNHNLDLFVAELQKCPRLV